MTIKLLFISILGLVGSCHLSATNSIPSKTKSINSTSNSSSIDPNKETIDKFYEAVNNNTQLALDMLDGEFPADFEPKNRIRPIEACIWHNNLEVLKKLVENNAKIDSGDFSAIEVASEYGTFEILKYLIEKKGSIENRAFNIAKDYRCAKYLLEQGASQDIGYVQGKLDFYIQAVRKSDIASLKLLVLNDDNMNYNTCEGETALIIAIKKQDITLVDYLLNIGVNVSKPETFDCGDEIYFGKNPMEFAKKTKNDSIIDLLKIAETKRK